MIQNNLTQSKTEPGHPDSNIQFITVSYQPIYINANVLTPALDNMLYTIGIVFKPNVKHYNFFLDSIETEAGKKVTITVATKANVTPQTPAHVFTYGNKPYLLSFTGEGQQFIIEDIVLNDEPTEPINSEQIRAIAAGRKKNKSVSVFTGPAIIHVKVKSDEIAKSVKLDKLGNSVKLDKIKGNLSKKKTNSTKSAKNNLTGNL